MDSHTCIHHYSLREKLRVLVTVAATNKRRRRLQGAAGARFPIPAFGVVSFSGAVSFPLLLHRILSAYRKHTAAVDRGNKSNDDLVQPQDHHPRGGMERGDQEEGEFRCQRRHVFRPARDGGGDAFWSRAMGGNVWGSVGRPCVIGPGGVCSSCWLVCVGSALRWLVPAGPAVCLRRRRE